MHNTEISTDLQLSTYQLDTQFFQVILKVSIEETDT